MRTRRGAASPIARSPCGTGPVGVPARGSRGVLLRGDAEEDHAPHARGPRAAGRSPPPCRDSTGSGRAGRRSACGSRHPPRRRAARRGSAGSRRTSRAKRRRAGVRRRRRGRSVRSMAAHSTGSGPTREAPLRGTARRTARARDASPAAPGTSGRPDVREAQLDRSASRRRLAHRQQRRARTGSATGPCQRRRPAPPPPAELPIATAAGSGRRAHALCEVVEGLRLVDDLLGDREAGRPRGAPEPRPPDVAAPEEEDRPGGRPVRTRASASSRPVPAAHERSTRKPASRAAAAVASPTHAALEPGAAAGRNAARRVRAGQQHAGPTLGLREASPRRRPARRSRARSRSRAGPRRRAPSARNTVCPAAARSRPTPRSRRTAGSRLAGDERAGAALEESPRPVARPARRPRPAAPSASPATSSRPVGREHANAQPHTPRLEGRQRADGRVAPRAERVEARALGRRARGGARRRAASAGSPRWPRHPRAR